MVDATPAGSEQTIIKKYANRRLYNTDTAKFVTLDDLHNMVKRGEGFVVQDAKTKRDITCSVLAQIIAEEETKGHNMLPQNYLRQVLQAYSDGIGPQLGAYLEQSIDAFSANQQQLVQQMQNMFAGEGTTGAMEQFAEIGRRNVEVFQRSMNMFAPPAAGRAAPDVAETQSKQDEIKSLKQQLEELQNRLDTLSGTN